MPKCREGDRFYSANTPRRSLRSRSAARVAHTDDLIIRRPQPRPRSGSYSTSSDPDIIAIRNSSAATLSETSPKKPRKEKEKDNKRRKSFKGILRNTNANTITPKTTSLSEISQDLVNQIEQQQQMLVLIKAKQDQLLEEEAAIQKRIEDLKEKEKESQKNMRQSWGPQHKIAAHKQVKNKEIKFKVHTDRISVCHRLGSGGSGAVVYSCLVDGWVCAMKQLASENKIELAAFEREMSLLYELPEHPNIVKYLFHCTIDGKMCLFMTQYSTTLQKIIATKLENEEPFSEQEICGVAKKIISGIQFLHKNDIIHRDIKSENIYCTPSCTGQLQEVVIADFDTAKRTNKSTAQLSTIGTLGYMAPEVYDNNSAQGSYTFSADIFSFGMVLYSMLSLREPFYEINNPFRIYDAIYNEKYPTLTDEQLSRYSPGLIKLHRSCIRVNASLRPTTSEILILLEQLTWALDNNAIAQNLEQKTVLLSEKVSF